MNKKVAIWGVGNWGRRAIIELSQYYCIDYLIDSAVLETTEMYGHKVVPKDYFFNDVEKPFLFVAISNFEDVEKELRDRKIRAYQLYYPSMESFYSKDVLVYNTYDYREEIKTENDIQKQNNEKNKRWIDARVWLYNDIGGLKKPSFIEIETYNRCNGICDFCPVNAKSDPRAEMKMTDELFHKIIDQLSEMDYSGRLSLFSNNEPFLDERIIDFQRYARKKLPNAYLHLFTNGTKLDIRKFEEIIDNLDELIIDNYNQELRLIPNCKRIVEYCSNKPNLISKVTIVMRKPHEVLTTRGGDAPNRSEKRAVTGVKCTNPFAQMVIRPDGKVSLCCNDPLGKMTLGDLRYESIIDVWNGEKFGEIRKKINIGRERISHCRYCDVFNVL